MSRTRSAEIVVQVDPTTVFDVLADPAQHALFDGSESVKGRLAGPPRLYLGAKFAMVMRIAAPYLTRNVVVEYEEDRRIAWRHFARHIWRYDLLPVAEGTRVVETFDYDPAPLAPLYERFGIPDHNERSIKVTLERLKVLVESRAALPASR
jgi:Polyketide cyclase / dehydrase and lipid transport